MSHSPADRPDASAIDFVEGEIVDGVIDDETDFDQATDNSQPEPPPALDLIASYAFVFRAQDFVIILVLGFTAFVIAQLFQLMGLVAVVVFWGYIFSVIETLIADRRQTCPVFEFPRFGEYLHRGIWPFVLTLPYWLTWTFQPLAWYLASIISLLIFLTTQENENAQAAMSIGIPTFIFLLLILGYVMMLFIIPMTLRAGLTRSFKEGFAIGWVRDFIRRTWIEIGLAYLFLVVVSNVMFAMGLLIACFGACLAQAWTFLAFGHLNYQLYALHLARGGQPVPAYQPHAYATNFPPAQPLRLQKTVDSAESNDATPLASSENDPTKSTET
jgi:hypothetical protein